MAAPAPPPASGRCRRLPGADRGGSASAPAGTRLLLRPAPGDRGQGDKGTAASAGGGGGARGAKGEGGEGRGAAVLSSTAVVTACRDVNSSEAHHRTAAAGSGAGCRGGGCLGTWAQPAARRGSGPWHHPHPAAARRERERRAPAPLYIGDGAAPLLAAASSARHWLRSGPADWPPSWLRTALPPSSNEIAAAAE